MPLQAAFLTNGRTASLRLKRTEAGAAIDDIACEACY